MHVNPYDYPGAEIVTPWQIGAKEMRAGLLGEG